MDAVKLFTDFLLENKLESTLHTFRKELLAKIPQRPSDQLIAAIQNVDTSNQPHSGLSRPTASRKHPAQHAQPLPPAESQKIMQLLLNKIAFSKKLLNDEAVNRNVQKIMNTKVFQRLVENTEVFQDAEDEQDRSFSNLASQLPQYNDVSAGNKLSQNDDSLDQSSVSYHDQLDFVVSKPSPQPFLNAPQTLQVNHLEWQLTEKYEFKPDKGKGFVAYSFLSPTGYQELVSHFRYPDYGSKNTLSPKSTPKPKSLPAGVKFPDENSDFKFKYPYLDRKGTTYNCIKLKVIYDREKTGYEPTKQLPIIPNSFIAGRYFVVNVIGSGAFAHALEVHDNHKNTNTCLKLIANDKSYFDNALSEVMILKYIKANCDPDKSFILNFHTAFYHKEHLFIETELLKQDLLKLYQRMPTFFSLSKIQTTAKQMLVAIAQLNRMGVVHCDLKPQNILVKSYDPFQVRVADVGNATFEHERMSYYIQSRSYRAPEVMLGHQATKKIDVWSIGCIVAELFTRKLLFQGSNSQEMLASIQSVMGAWPEWMLKGEQSEDILTAEGVLYTEKSDECGRKIWYLVPNYQNNLLQARMKCKDQKLLSFIRFLLQVDPNLRPSAQQALSHPFLSAKYDI